MVVTYSDDVHRRQRRGGATLHRLAAAAVVSLLVTTACGTRLDDSAIEAAAGVGAAAGETGGTAADDFAAGGSFDTGGVSDIEAGLGAGEATADAGAGSAPSTPAAKGAGSPPGAATRPASRAGGGSNRAQAGTAAPAAGRSGGGRASAAAPGPATPAPGIPAPRRGGETTPAPGRAPATKPPIVFGHIGDYSGLVGTVMKGGNVVAQVIARHTNDRGGLDGHPIRVITGDAGGDPARALSLARDMVENKGAVAFVGTMMVFSGYGPREYLEERKIPVIGGDGTTKVWLESPVYFTSSANFPVLSLGALKGLVDLGKRKIAVLHCVEAEQCKVWRDTAVANASKLGAEIVYDQQVSFAQPDFTAECIQAQRNGADGMLTGIDGPSIVRLARSCSQQGYRPQMMTASVAVIEPIAEDPNLEGLMAPQGNAPHMATDLAALKEFHAALKQYAPSVQKSPAVVNVWTAGVLLAEVARHGLPAGEVTSADFFPGLYAIKNNTLGGMVAPLTFDEGGLAEEPRCVFYVRIIDARWEAPFGSKQVCV